MLMVHCCALMPAQRDEEEAKAVDHFRAVLKHNARVSE
jgi:hypothetical protein